MVVANKKVKCPTCGTMNDKDNTVKISGRYYCIECGEERNKEKSRNTDGWDNLYSYMKELYGQVDGKMISLVAKYRKEPYNYTNEGMRLTLYYYHILLDNSTNTEATGLIPYYYQKAKLEYIDNIEVREFNSQCQPTQKINRIKVCPIKNKNKYSIGIDLSHLGGTEDEQ